MELKNEGPEPMLLNDQLKIGTGTGIVNSSSHFPMIEPSSAYTPPATQLQVYGAL
jgi:hypothetical protein